MQTSIECSRQESNLHPGKGAGSEPAAYACSATGACCAAFGARRGARQWDAPPDDTSQGRDSNPQLRGMNPARYPFLHPAIHKTVGCRSYRSATIWWAAASVKFGVRGLLYQLSHSPAADQTPRARRRRSVRPGVACIPSAPHAAGRPPGRRCACIDVKQLSMGASEMKNAPPAWCAGGASGRSLPGFRALVHGPLPSYALSSCRPPIRGSADLDIAES